LPSSSIWYNYYSKQIHSPTVGGPSLDWINDMEQGTFIKGGSIVPILAHKRELSLLNAIKNDVKLEIYPDEN